MIVVTGGEGFIGRNLIMELQKRGYNDVIPLDTKYETLDEIYDWFHINSNDIECVFHLGAITDTTEMNVDLFDEYNLNCSKFIWDICTAYKIPLIYASSAATYGDGELGFNDELPIDDLKPLNPYGESKQQFDMWVLEQQKNPPFWAGLKFFNVYGYGEEEKGKMASVALQLFKQLKETGNIKLFKSHNPIYKDGGQLRDFVYVEDVVDICIWLMEYMPKSGIYNVGTGKARTFYDLAKNVYMNYYDEPEMVERIIKAFEFSEKLTYIDIPLLIRDKYQYFTEARINKLRKIGYVKPFTELEEGVRKYIKKLKY